MPTVRQRYRQTDGRTNGRTDDLRLQYRALHYVHRAVKTKREVDLMTRCRDMVIRNFPRWRHVGFGSTLSSAIRSADT